jgi:hypothetical protein
VEYQELDAPQLLILVRLPHHLSCMGQAVERQVLVMTRHPFQEGMPGRANIE